MKFIKEFGLDHKAAGVMLVAAVVLLMTACVFAASCRENRKDALLKEPYRIMIATDLHYLSPALTDNGSFFTELVRHGDGKAVMFSEEIAEALIRHGRKEKPDVLILSGDLTFNGEKKSHRELTEKLRKLRDEGITVLVIPGNHDLNNGQASQFKGDSYERVDSISAGEFQELYKGFSSSYAIARDKDSLSYMYESRKGVRLLMLDVNGVSQPGSVAEATFGWIERQLKQAKAERVPVIAVSHQNLLAHNAVFSKGFVIENRNRLETLYKKYGVISNLSGHMHLQHTRTDGLVPEIVTGSAAVWPHYYGILSFDGERLDYSAKPMRITGTAGQRGGAKDLAEHSRELFMDISYEQAIEELGDRVPDEQQRYKMADDFAQLNSLYFRGRMDKVQNQDSDALWSQYVSGTFLEAYIKSILVEKARNHTKLTIK